MLHVRKGMLGARERDTESEYRVLLCYVNELYYRIIKYEVAVDITCCYYHVRFDYVYVVS